MEATAASVQIDGRTVLEGVPLVRLPLEGARPELSMFRTAGSGSDVWVEDLEVRFQDRTLAPLVDEELTLKPIITETFDRYAAGGFPRSGGWSVVRENVDDSGVRAKRRAVASGKIDPEAEIAVIDETERTTPPKSFKLRSSAAGEVPVIKVITLPEQIPYDVSSRSFSIVADVNRPTDGEPESGNELGRRSKGKPDPAGAKEGRRAAGSGSRNPARLDRPGANKPGTSGSGGTTRTLSAGTAANFYLCSFDGRLLALKARPDHPAMSQPCHKLC